jgi:ferredoxin-NADP reductase
VVLFAGGIGITALRALLEDLPKGSEPIVLLRTSTAEQLVLHDEVTVLVKRLKGSVHLLVGSRSEVGGARQVLRRLVPDLAGRDLFACGPEGFVQDVVAAARALGVHSDCVHTEVFSW